MRPVLPPSETRRLTRSLVKGSNLEKRDVPSPAEPTSGSDYVFLDEQIVASDGDPLAFTAIDQTYRHLVLELLLQAVPGLVTSAYLAWNGVEEEYDSAEIASDTADTPTGSNASDSSGVFLKDIVPVTPTTDPLYAMVTAKLPYYAQASLIKGLLWQAVSINDGVENVITASGGGLSVYQVDESEADTDPVTSLEVLPAKTDGTIVPGSWAAGTRGSLYGIT